VKLSTDSLECIICTEIPIKVLETACCGALLCDKCAVKLTKCPNRCQNDDLKLQENKFVQRMISDIPVKCEYCANEFARKSIMIHQSVCDENPSKPLLLNTALHP